MRLSSLAGGNRSYSQPCWVTCMVLFKIFGYFFAWPWVVSSHACFAEYSWGSIWRHPSPTLSSAVKTLASLVSLDNLVYFLNSGRLLGSPGLPLPALKPGNSPRPISWDSCRAHIVIYCFLGVTILCCWMSSALKIISSYILSTTQPRSLLESLGSLLF